MKGFLISLLVLSIHLTYAQQYRVIQGQVSDGATGSPLPFCSVFVKGEVIGTVANVQGRFKLNIPGEMGSDTLVVSHVGFKNYYAVVADLPARIKVKLEEATIDLNAIQVETDRLTAQEVFNKAIQKITLGEGYPDQDFRMDGFFREVHQSDGERTGILECAISVFDDDVTRKFKDIAINQFRKVYDRKQNTDQFIQTKEGHNHLLLLLNNGINLIPLAKKHKSSVWRLPLEIEELTYFNDRLVYVLNNEAYSRTLKLYVDVEDFTVYKNELILEVGEADHENYVWRKMNSKGQDCGAIYDHQSYEYRKVGGKLFPYYSFRRFDFRCYDMKSEEVISTAYLSKELLINHVEFNPVVTPTDKLRKKQGLINRKEPYDSAFWKYFNDIQGIDLDMTLQNDKSAIPRSEHSKSSESTVSHEAQHLKIGDHATRQFTRADTLYGTLSPDLTCYDVNHYELDLEIDVDQETIGGVVTMNFEVIRATKQIRIDLMEYLTIEKITHQERELSFERDLDAVHISFDDALMPRGKYAIKVSYHGHPLEADFDEKWTSGFLWGEDSEGISFAQTLCQGYGAKGWWPVKNHLSDEPEGVDIKVTVPSGLVAVANGQLIEVDTIGDTRRYHWKTSNPINTYNIAVHIGNYTSTGDSYVSSNSEELQLDYFFLANDEDLAKENVEMVPKMLAIYERYFGPYPFQEDGFKLVQSPYPMEHQSCVAVGPYFDDFLILHETAHEWWGNHVSVADNADIWIHEAFATYAESLYLEGTLGYEMGQKYLNSRKSEIQNDHPLVGVYGVNHFHYRIEDKYTKGSLMLNTLRHVVNDDELWFEALKGIQEDFSHGFIDTETLTDYLQLQLEMNLTSFFNQYLTTTEVPVLELKKGTQGFAYRWTNARPSFLMPIRIGENEVLPMMEWQQSVKRLRDIDVVELMNDYLIRVDVSSEN